MGRCAARAPYAPATAARGSDRGQRSEPTRLIDFSVTAEHSIAGSAVRELGLPRSAIVAVISRGDDSIPPRGSTVIEPGDRLFVLAPRPTREAVEDAFSRWRRRI